MYPVKAYRVFDQNSAPQNAQNVPIAIVVSNLGLGNHPSSDFKQTATDLFRAFQTTNGFSYLYSYIFYSNIGFYFSDIYKSQYHFVLYASIFLVRFVEMPTQILPVLVEMVPTHHDCQRNDRQLFEKITTCQCNRFGS